MSRSALACLVSLLAVASAAAQETPDQQARRLLEDGRTYRSQGKLKQAFDNFTIVVSSFPGTDSVGQALLEIGRYRLDVEGDLDKARAAFEQVTKEHARSDAAPGAYYHMGLLTLARAAGPADVEDALAQFMRVETLYPHSLWVPRALHGAAMAHRRAGRYRRGGRPRPQGLARVPRERRGRGRAVRDRPGAGAAGRAAAGDGGVPAGPQPLPARASGRSRRSSGSRSCIGCSAGRSPCFAADAGFTLAAGEFLKNVKALAMAPGGALWIASGKMKAAAMVDTSAADGERHLRGGPEDALPRAARGDRARGQRHRSRRSQGHPSLRVPARQAGRRPAAGRQHPRRGPDRRRLRARVGRGSRPRAALRREGQVPRDLSPERHDEPERDADPGGPRRRDPDARPWPSACCGPGTRTASCCAAWGRRESSARTTSRSIRSATCTWPTRSSGCWSSIPRDACSRRSRAPG